MTADTEEDGNSQVIRRRGMRTGFTTGACATAAATAATRSLLSREPVTSVTIPLPAGVNATFAVQCCEARDGAIRCSVIKDAGDDPDVTHGAEIAAVVQRQDAAGIVLLGGKGVGVVTLPGLGLEIGGPAINPVPRRMILEAVTAEAGSRLEHGGLIVEISVPRGEELARRTLNARLGILGGISILGTTGIVRPYSTAAYRASVEQGVDVAVANGQREIALSTGGRSERFAQSVLSLPEIAFVEMGEFTGHALRRCVRKGVSRAYVCGMIGKLSKVAQGHFMTHVAGNSVDTAYLASLAAEAGAGPALQTRMAAANTAREVQELALAEHLGSFFERVASATASSCATLVRGAIDVECLLFDFDGTLLGRSAGARGGPRRSENAS
jgi:cobalt-precorrin-5B (C1)-methyltransferase